MFSGQAWSTMDKHCASFHHLLDTGFLLLNQYPSSIMLLCDDPRINNQSGAFVG
jgi:hypothetical protein